MYHIAIDGFRYGVTTTSVSEATELISSLLHAGYSVKVNALSVGLYYGPGYDTVTWSEGDYSGQSLYDTASQS